MEGKKHTVTLAGFLITIIGSILFSTKAIIVKVAFANTSMDALTLLMLRMTFSLPFYLGAIWFARQEGLKPLTTRQWMGVIGLGLFGYYLSSLFDFTGLQYVTAGLERLILFLYPTFAVLINSIVFKQPVVRTQQIALLLTYTGIGIAYLGELRIDVSNPNFIWGSFLIFLCSITYSIYIVGSGRMIPTVGVTRFTAYAMLSSTAGVFAHFIFGGGSLQLLQEAGTHVWYGILLAVLATVLPTFMLSNGMKRIGSNNVAIISAIGPVSTIIQAHFILGEKIFPAQIAGTVLVIIGVILIGWKRN
ncbi:DMT family transporter [Longitalea arenae]|uniref:DMT family transporter n=1 Tax=Longitalea arenae TaxID=2812558 RepID=UPI00196834B5|nr:DMT family transporter [Longitalea arenae]